MNTGGAAGRVHSRLNVAYLGSIYHFIARHTGHGLSHITTLRLTLGLIKGGGPHTPSFCSSLVNPSPPLVSELLLQSLNSGVPRSTASRLSACKTELCIGWCSAAEILSWFWVTSGFLFSICNLSLKNNHSNLFSFVFLPWGLCGVLVNSLLVRPIQML